MSAVALSNVLWLRNDPHRRDAVGCRIWAIEPGIALLGQRLYVEDFIDARMKLESSDLAAGAEIQYRYAAASDRGESGSGRFSKGQSRGRGPARPGEADEGELASKRQAAGVTGCKGDRLDRASRSVGPDEPSLTRFQQQEFAVVDPRRMRHRQAPDHRRAARDFDHAAAGRLAGTPSLASVGLSKHIHKKKETRLAADIGQSVRNGNGRRPQAFRDKPWLPPRHEIVCCIKRAQAREQR